MPSRQNNTAQRPDQQQTEDRMICVKYIPVNDATDLDIGDHVVLHRSTYDHHGIITNKRNELTFQITEATNTGSGFFSASIVRGKANIRQIWVQFNFQKHRVSVADYTRYRLPKAQTVSLANEIYDESTKRPGSYKYNLITNNCEHFATFCATGKMYSLQVEEFVSNGFKSLIRSLFIHESRRNNETCLKCIGIPCVNIKSEDDVKKGDIIKYLEVNVWHHAVVIKTYSSSPTNKTVNCFVAHHNSCTPLSSKKIETKDIIIRFEDNFYIVNYASSQYGVSEYNPEEVWKRAVDKIGKTFVANECSHFPIWCKIYFDKKDLFKKICKTFD